MVSEFDGYAGRYAELLKDPLRARFSTGERFFYERKWLVLSGFFAARGLLPKNLEWLDVGCGRGDLLALAAGKFRRAAGCDPSRRMLEEVRGAEGRVQEPPGRIPFPGASFDFVTAVCVYHHVPLEDRDGLTRELYRVLRPGGIACIIEHNPFNPVTRAIVRRCPVDADARLLTASRSRGHLRKAGFTVLKTEYFLCFPERLFQRWGHMEAAISRLPLGGQYATFAARSEPRLR